MLSNRRTIASEGVESPLLRVADPHSRYVSQCVFKGPLPGTSVDDKPHDRSVTAIDAFVEDKVLTKLRGTPATYKRPPINLTPLIVALS